MPTSATSGPGYAPRRAPFHDPAAQDAEQQFAPVAVLIVLVLAGGIYLRITGSDTPEGGTNAAEGGENSPDVSANASFATDVPIPVEGAAVVQDTLVVSVAAAAQAAAQRRATRKTQVQGRVTAVRVTRPAPTVRGRLSRSDFGNRPDPACESAF